jgi:adenosine deaminase CECR1
MNQGIPVVLSSDDPAIFNNMGLSFDFFQVISSFVVRSWNQTHRSRLQVIVASEVTGLLTLGQMARDSITVSHFLRRVSPANITWLVFYA